MSEQSKVFVVSGASRGLGRDIVVSALAAGHRVVAGARSTAALDDLASAHREHLAVVELDVTDDDQVRAGGDGTCVLVVEDNEQVGRFATAPHCQLR